MTLAGFIVCGSWPAEVLAKVVDHHKDENGVPLSQKKPLDGHQSTARKKPENPGAVGFPRNREN
jgi:hypothetical protein